MAGFMAGFGEQLSSSIEARKKTLDRLIEDNLDNARIAKKEYSNRKNQADQVLKSAEAIRASYGLDESQTLQLAEAYGTDLPQLQNVLDKNSSKLVSDQGVRYNASDVMSYVNAAETLNLPEGVSLAEGVNRLMGLTSQELSKEKDPKSEGSKSRSFIRAALTLDPQLDAAEKMENMTGPNGLTYAQLLEMQESGFAKEDVFGNVTRAGGITYDYTSTTAKQTRDDYSKVFSNNIYNEDLTNPLIYNNYTALEGTDKAKLKSEVFGAGTALSKLERSIVSSFRGTDLAMNALRKGILDDIAERVDDPEELRSLIDSVGSGFAISVIEAKDGKLTDEDIDSIITGVVVESSTEKPVIEKPVIEKPVIEEPVIEEPVIEKPVIEEPVIEEPGRTSIVDDLLKNTDEDDGEEESVSPIQRALGLEKGIKVAQTNIQNRENARKAMADVTRKEWDDMTRAERREAGLPVRKLDVAYAGKSYFKKEEGEEVAATPEVTGPAINNVTDLVLNNTREINDLIDSEGLTSESSEAEVRAVLTGWYNENQDGPIGDFVAKADMRELKRVEDAVKAVLATRSE